jgi:hypothetical protein
VLRPLAFIKSNAPRAVAGLFLFSLLLGLLLPVYADEVGWRLQERAGFDGLDKLYSEQCGPNTLAVPVWFMWPARWYSALFNGLFPDPFWLRVSGVGYALGWAAMLFVFIGRIARHDEQRWHLIAMASALMGMGALPMLLVWSRPEQPILLAFTGAIVLAWRGEPRSTAGVAGRLLWIGLLGAIALSYHFKALVLMPLFVACLLLCDRQRKTLALRLGACAVLAVLAAQAARYWGGRLDCPGDAVMAAQHAQQSLALTLMHNHSGPLGMLWMLIANFMPTDYIVLAAPRPDPMSDWLAPLLVSRGQQTAWRVMMLASWILSFALALVCWGQAAHTAWRQRVLTARLVLPVMAFGTACVWCVGQLVRNPYESPFVLPLLLLAIVLAISAPTAPPRASLRWLSRALALGMVVSQIGIAVAYGPSLVAAARQSGYVAGQPMSVSVVGYAGERTKILAAARLCGITPQSHPHNLLLDDATYFAFMRSPQPDHQISVLDPKWNGAVADPIAYLRQRQSSGVVVACRWLPAGLRARAHGLGGYCCLAPPGW